MYHTLWPASWLPAVDNSRGSKSAEVQRVWEFYDERLQFMSRQDASLLDESLDAGMMSLWLGLSGLGLLSLRLLMRLGSVVLFLLGVVVLGRGSALLSIVQLGGPWVRRARANVADALDAADIFIYRDFSLAPLLDMRRRFKAVMDVLGALIRYGVSLSRSVELTAQWDRVLALGPMYLVILDDLSLDRALGISVHSFMLLLMFIAVLVISSIRLWFIAVMR